VRITLPFFVELLVPYGLFALAAGLLWRRRRTFATLLMALGFVATLVGEVAGFHVHHHISPLLTHYATLVGLWAAAVAMVWHAAASR